MGRSEGRAVRWSDSWVDRRSGGRATSCIGQGGFRVSLFFNLWFHFHCALCQLSVVLRYLKAVGGKLAACTPVTGCECPRRRSFAHAYHAYGILFMCVGHALLGVGKSPLSMRFSLRAVLRFAGLKRHTFASLSTQLQHRHHNSHNSIVLYTM